MSVNIGPRIGIDGEAEYRKAIQNIIQETRTLKSEFEKIASDTGMNSFKKAAEESKVVAKQIEEQQKRIAELQKGYDEAAKKWGADDTKTLKWKQAINEATTELNNLQAKLKEIPNAVELIGQKFQDWGNNIKSVGDKISGVGKSITTRVTLPLVGAGTVAVNKFAEVDKTMTLANQTMGNSKSQAELLSKAMAEAASNSTFGMSEAAQASLNFARAGLTAEQAAKTLAPSMNLAAGAGGDLNTVSAGLVATINGFLDSFENASKYADIFAAATNNSALDVNSLVSSMSVAAPVFNAAGYSVKDAALYMGTMADNGIEANTAANALKTGLARLASPAKEGREQLKKLGIEIFNADGSMKDSLTVQSLLHNSFAKLSEQEQIAAASAIFGKNQMSSWLALINAAPPKVNELADSLDNAAGTVDRMAKAMMSGFGGSLEKLKSSVDVAATSLGEALAPTILQVAETTQKAVDWFNSLDKSHRELIAKVGLMVAAVGPALIIGGKVVSGVGSIISVGGKLVSGIGTLMKASGGLTNAIPAVSSALGGVSSLITGSVVPAFSGAGAFLTGTMIPAIGSLGSSIASLIVAALPVIAVIGGIVGAGVLLYKNWDTIGEKAHELGSTVSENWKALKENTYEDWENLRASVHNAIDSAKESATARAEEIKNNIHDKWEEVKENTHEACENIREKSKETWKNIRSTVSDAVDNIVNKVREKVGEITNFFKELPSKALSWGKDMINNFTDGIKNAGSNIKDKVTGVADSIKERLGFSEPEKGPLSDFHTYAPDMMKLFAKGIKDNTSLITDQVNRSFNLNPMIGHVPDHTSNSVNIGDTVINIYGAQGQDVNELADIIDEKINAKYARIQAAWA